MECCRKEGSYAVFQYYLPRTAVLRLFLLLGAHHSMRVITTAFEILITSSSGFSGKKSTKIFAKSIGIYQLSQGINQARHL